MNIDTIKNNESHNTLDRSIPGLNNLNEINSFSFELELPNSASFAELIQPEKAPVKKADNQTESSEKISTKLLKKIQDLATKDKVPYKQRDIKDIRLLIHSHDLLHMNDKLRVSLDSMDDKDAKFLKQCIDNPNIIINTVNSQNYQVQTAIVDGQISYKSFDISKGLANLIEYASKTQKPIRLDFEGNSSVILRIDADGKLSAEFMSSNKAMEYILKSSLPHLRNRLDSENLPYKEIFYKDRNKKQNSEEQERS